MHDVIIVGSGVGGVGAALELVEQGIRPLVLDVGHDREPDAPQIEANLYDYRKRHDCYDFMIGRQHQGIRNLLSHDALPPRLVAPGFSYVTRDVETLSPIENIDFDPIMSFSKGGLANAWGAGLYRYNDYDLEGFPITERDLAPYYDKLTKEIGISGTDDDLTPYFGPSTNLQPPLRMSSNIKRMYSAYQRKRARLNAKGIYLGHARVAALSEPTEDRAACSYDNMEFFQYTPFVYTPAFSLQRLVREGAVDYRRPFLVDSWEELPSGGIRVKATNTASGEPVTFDTQKLILAAGTINTSKIVLKSRNDYGSKLRLLDCCSVQIPMVVPAALGQPLDTHTFGLVQLNLVWESEQYGARLQGSLLELSAVSRAVFFEKLPYCAGANMALTRYLLPALVAMNFQLPASVGPDNALSLASDGSLKIDGHPNKLELGKLSELLGALRSLGAWSHQAVCAHSPTGHAMHYAGTLPMAEAPADYGCDPDGRLSGSPGVAVADGSVFTELPAKNASFTIMANASRIARRVADDLRESR